MIVSSEGSRAGEGDEGEDSRGPWRSGREGGDSSSADPPPNGLYTSTINVNFYWTLFPWPILAQNSHQPSDDVKQCFHSTVSRL